MERGRQNAVAVVEEKDCGEHSNEKRTYLQSCTNLCFVSMRYDGEGRIAYTILLAIMLRQRDGGLALELVEMVENDDRESCYGVIARCICDRPNN